MKFHQTFILGLLAISLAGCGTQAVSNTKAPLAPLQLTATLTSPIDIALQWNAIAGAAGYTVDWSTDTNGQYVILAFLTPDQITFAHTNLMPMTTGYYRIRPYFGPASPPVEVSLPESLSQSNYVARFGEQEDYDWAVPKSVETGAEEQSIRTNMPAVTPTNLKAALMPVTVSGFELTWTNHASDADGILLESMPEGSGDFHPCALLAPNINALGYGLVPPVKKASFRVRPFYYGTPSNVAQQKTGR